MKGKDMEDSVGVTWNRDGGVKITVRKVKYENITKISANVSVEEAKELLEQLQETIDILEGRM